jgi:SAM-dependent methyltransferase
VSSGKENRVSKARWLVAQQQEQQAIESEEDIRCNLQLRRRTWGSLVDSLKDGIAFDNSKRVLDIGGGPTSIFLSLREGEKYVVDPNIERLFQLHPFIREVEEYKDVNFISSPIEEAAVDGQFDLIFLINVLDHVGELKPITDKIDCLLAPSGTLVVVVDSYADRAVRNINRFFDVDLPHPHHFVDEDIIRLFSSYKLKQQDSEIFKVIDEGRGEIEIYRIDKFANRMRQVLNGVSKRGDTLYISKYILCYGLALLIASLRRQEKPIHPLRKARLFVFEKDQA